MVAMKAYSIDLRERVLAACDEGSEDPGGSNKVSGQ
jgi:hypothetical protein